jgi:hypothetical protein
MSTGRASTLRRTAQEKDSCYLEALRAETTAAEVPGVGTPMALNFVPALGRKERFGRPVTKQHLI